MPRRQRRKRRVRFEAGKVFAPSKGKGDLEFDLGAEVARFKAKKGEAGNRAPPPVPPSVNGGPGPWAKRRWS